MKKNLLVLIIIASSSMFSLIAQEKVDALETSYRRSSLHTILLEMGDFLNKDMVMNAYNLAPFPDKYNDHRLEGSVIKFDEYLDLNPEELVALTDTSAAAEADKDKVKKKEKLQTQAIENYLSRNKIANQLVAKWFGRDENGAFNMDLIHERGSYDATEMAAQMAQNGIRGLASLKDAGEELISNTFVVINKMSFIKNEPYARAIRDGVYIAATQISNSIVKMATETAADIAYNMTKDGYSVWTISYLYQLDWNEDVANAFYTDMWMDATSIDENKKALFDNSDIFKLKYLGFEKAKSLVLVAVGKEPQAVIQQATIRNIDKVYTKLQKAYDVFKTKTPIYSAEPLMAKIGMKEGVEPNDKFEVLEQVYDSKTGLTKYAQVAVVKAEKGKIWDNQYDMGVDGEKSEESKLEGTQFKGGSKKILPGMLLRQVK